MGALLSQELLAVGERIEVLWQCLVTHTWALITPFLSMQINLDGNRRTTFATANTVHRVDLKCTYLGFTQQDWLTTALSSSHGLTPSLPKVICCYSVVVFILVHVGEGQLFALPFVQSCVSRTQRLLGLAERKV
jgi:hypothetical protein